MSFPSLAISQNKTVPGLIVLLILILVSGASSGHKKKDYLRLVSDTSNNCGYINARGDTVISYGKYIFCFTERFEKCAIVYMRGKGFVGIDRQERVLFNVYPFDNGPDYPSDGLFRILDKGKIGYADLKGNIVIQPQYDCAFPFKHHKAFVGFGCKTQSHGEHHSWVGGKWFLIDRHGKVIKELSRNPYR